jgi:uncharacterized protein (TIGR00369 family)
MKEIAKYSHCFVCGDKNDHGLQARFFFDGRKAVTELTAGQAFEGYRGIYHGGILATLLDEVMIKSILAGGVYAVTAELSVRYLAPVSVGDELVCTGWITRRKGRVYLTEGEAKGGDGTIYATATAKYIEAKAALKDSLEASVD